MVGALFSYLPVAMMVALLALVLPVTVYADEATRDQAEGAELLSSDDETPEMLEDVVMTALEEDVVEESDSDNAMLLAETSIQGSTIASVKVYSEPATSSSVVMTLKVGTSIKVTPYKDSWYTAKLNKQTVYLQLNAKNFVEFDPIDNKEHEGAVITKSISVYVAPSEKSKAVDSFPEGTGMRFKSFNDDYYMASYRGKTVYIPTSKIELYTATSTKTVVMYATDKGVKIYAAPTTKSKVVASFDANTALSLRPFSDDWFVSSMKGKTVYIPASQVSSTKSGFVIKYTDYNISLSKMVSLSNTGDRTIVKNGKWLVATDSDIREHVDPRNYPQDSTGFFQFMRLDIPSTATTSQLNSYLNGKGILSGQGAAFKEGARDAGLNELYLIAHAIHETGNGTSRLAQGVWYNPKTNKVQDSSGNGAVKVYNMYGIGAVDTDVIRGGARTAYNNGWTTPAKAITGGARYVGANYISPGGASMSGQDTLYKMLWNPEAAAKNPGNLWHRYATDVNWASAQGYYLAQMYREFGSISITFDVPRYK